MRLDPWDGPPSPRRSRRPRARASFARARSPWMPLRSATRHRSLRCSAPRSRHLAPAAARAVPPPAYPPIAERRGLSGTVLLAIEVAASGVTGVRIERSSGHDVLDEAARRAVRVALQAGVLPSRPTAATVNKPIEFTLPAGR